MRSHGPSASQTVVTLVLATMLALTARTAGACSCSPSTQPPRFVPESGTTVPANGHFWIVVPPGGDCHAFGCAYIKPRNPLRYTLKPGHGAALPLDARMMQSVELTVIELTAKRRIRPGDYQLVVTEFCSPRHRARGTCSPGRPLATYTVTSAMDREPPSWDGFSETPFVLYCEPTSKYQDSCGGEGHHVIAPISSPQGAQTTTGGAMFALWFSPPGLPTTARPPDIYVDGSRRIFLDGGGPCAGADYHLPDAPEVQMSAGAVDVAGNLSKVATVVLDSAHPRCPSPDQAPE